MSYRLRHAAVLGALALAIVSWTVVYADLRSDTFTSRSHLISLTRPDASWEVREHPAQKNAVALFSNGQGRVIVLLSHRSLEPSDAINSPGNLRKRWSDLASEIITMTRTGETSLTLGENNYRASDQGVSFEIKYSNHSPALGTRLENWIAGQIIRGSDGRQHIYAVRCAAPESSYDSWESQFAMFMPTLSYEGTRQTPVYTSAPIPRWWFIAGAVAALVVILLVRRGRNSQRVVITEDRLQQNRPRVQPVAAQSSQAPMSNVPEQTADGIPNVPDAMLVAADLSDVPDQVFRDAASDEQTYEDTSPKAQQSFWKCECGRMNSLDEEYCARCNADREPTNRKSLL